jgi:hypothetical protein
MPSHQNKFQPRKARLGLLKAGNKKVNTSYHKDQKRKWKEITINHEPGETELLLGLVCAMAALLEVLMAGEGPHMYLKRTRTHTICVKI